MSGTAVVVAVVALTGVGVGIALTRLTDDGADRPFSPEALPPAEVSTSATTRQTGAPSTSMPEPLTDAESLVFEACATPYRATQVGIELRAALVHESADDEGIRTGAALMQAAQLADAAANLDAEFSPFAAASRYWSDHANVPPSELADPQLDAALATVSDVCAQVGVPDGEAFIKIPYDRLGADTAERGRFDACEDLIFGPDGAVYVDGERFTYVDCDNATGHALNEPNHDDAYAVAVSSFLAEKGGFVCWGPECRDESDFQPH